METKVLLRLIKDDIKILENLNDSFINHPNLSPEEVEVALARAKALVMEFEMLNKNSSREEEVPVPVIDSGENPEEKTDEKNEKKVRSLRNFLPFIKSEEEKIISGDKSSEQKNEIAEKEASSQNYLSTEPVELKETFTLITDQVVEEGLQVSSNSLNSDVRGNHDPMTAVDTRTEPFSGDEKNQFANLLSAEKQDTKFGSIPLRSIREGIGLNDRFLFIRELFQNKTDQFEQTITALDEFVTIEDAVKFLKQNFKWSKSETAEKFLLLIKRRFSK